jgi:aryl-alcohol dehydrogenase-like predicted oxidoreductase
VTQAAFDVIEAHVAHANDKACTPSQLALAWNAAQPGITAPIIGPRTMDQLIDNLGAIDIELTPEDLARVDAVAPPKSVSLPYYDAAMGVDTRANLGRW